MNSTVTFIALVTIFITVKSNPVGKIIEYTNKVNSDGYILSYEIDDGSSRHEQGSYVKGKGDEVNYSVIGDHSFIFPHGTPFELFFTADKLGYHPMFRIGERKADPSRPEIPIPTAAIASAAGGGLGR